jgi:hypothetical protein
MGFDPVTIALVASAVFSAYSVYRQGQAAATESRAQADVADYNAKVAENEAKAVELKGAIEQRRQARNASRHIAKLEAGLGASGAVSTEGAPVALLAKQRSEFESDNMLIGFDTTTEAQRFESEAKLATHQGQLLRTRAKNQVTAGKLGAASEGFRAGATLMTGFA